MRMPQKPDSAADSAVPLDVTVQWGEDGDIVFLAGEFDFAAAPRLRAVIEALLATGRRQILVDLEAVTFMDGSAIGALISADQRTQRVGGSLKVTPNARCLRLLQLTGELDRLSFSQVWCTGGNEHPVVRWEREVQRCATSDQRSGVTPTPGVGS